jgi:hypothetical protein
MGLQNPGTQKAYCWHFWRIPVYHELSTTQHNDNKKKKKSNVKKDIK